MTRKNLTYAVAALFLALACSEPSAAVSTSPEKPKTASVSLGTEFASGKYGTDSTTRSMYMPLIVSWSPNDRFDASIELPYIYQSSPGVTTSLFQNSQTTTAAKAARNGGPGGNSGAARQQTVSSDSSVSGLGDIIMRFGVIALPEGIKIPQLRPTVFVKFPTASSSDGLGTGEFDAGGGLEATKWIGNLHLTGEALYTWQGKVDGFGLKNYFSYTAGVGYQFLDAFEPMLIVKGATSPSSYSGNLLEARARFIWSVTDATSFDLYGSRGFSTYSPDYGGGVSVIYSF